MQREWPWTALSQRQSFLRHGMWGNRRLRSYGEDWFGRSRKVVRFTGVLLCITWPRILERISSGTVWMDAVSLCIFDVVRFGELGME